MRYLILSFQHYSSKLLKVNDVLTERWDRIILFKKYWTPFCWYQQFGHDKIMTQAVVIIIMSICLMSILVSCNIDVDYSTYLLALVLSIVS